MFKLYAESRDVCLLAWTTITISINHPAPLLYIMTAILMPLAPHSNLLVFVPLPLWRPPTRLGCQGLNTGSEGRSKNHVSLWSYELHHGRMCVTVKHLETIQWDNQAGTESCPNPDRQTREHKFIHCLHSCWSVIIKRNHFFLRHWQRRPPSFSSLMDVSLTAMFPCDTVRVKSKSWDRQWTDDNTGLSASLRFISSTSAISCHTIATPISDWAVRCHLGSWFRTTRVQFGFNMFKHSNCQTSETRRLKWTLTIKAITECKISV